MQAVWHRVAEPEGLLRVDTGTLPFDIVIIAPARKLVMRSYACSHKASALVALQAGFTNIVHLEGGLSRWRYEGNSTEKSK